MPIRTEPKHENGGRRFLLIALLAVATLAAPVGPEARATTKAVEAARRRL